MKQVFIVSSSPRKGGNSGILAEEFARGAREAGHNVEKIDLRDMDLQFCIGCLSCQSRDGCVLKDGLNALYPRIQAADIIVFATPIYFYGMSGQLKTFLDRLNPLFPRKNKFQDVYLLAAAADAEDSAMNGAVYGLQGWIDCFDGVRLAGVVRGTGVTSEGEIKNSDAANEAYRMGKLL